MNKDALYNKLISQFNRCKTSREDWEKMATESYAFYHNNQWSDTDIDALKCQGRPTLTFNRIQPIISAIIGSEINNRRIISFIPREPGDVKPNEMLNSIAHWFIDEANGENHDTSIFKDCLITGLGWGEVTLDYKNSPKGKPCIRRLNPLKMFWDSNAQASNLQDAKALFYVNSLPIDELKAMFPNVDVSEFNYNDNKHKTDYDLIDTTDDKKSKDFGTIIEARYKVLEDFVLFTDPFNNKEVTLRAEEFDELSKEITAIYGQPINGLRFKKEIVKRAFLGTSKLLDDVDEPLAPSNHFGWICVSGHYDNIKNIYYGVVRSLIDAQKCINKTFSETIYNYNIQSKGGFFVENSAVDDLYQFRETLTSLNDITVLKDGGLGKIQQKPVGQVSSILPSLMNISESQLTNVTGISQEFLGTRETNQAGILEAHRKQASLNILAPLFDNLKFYRKSQGEIILYLIQNYLSDGRLVRIVGESKQEYVPLIKENIANLEYDIIIDDEPLYLNDSEKNFTIVQQLLPLLQPYMNPDLAMKILQYSPLPSSLIDSIQSNLQQQSQALSQPQPNLEDDKKQAEINKTMAQANKENSLAQYHNQQVIEKQLINQSEQSANNELNNIIKSFSS